MERIISLLKGIWYFIVKLFSREKKVVEQSTTTNSGDIKVYTNADNLDWQKIKLLKPKTHKRYISIYCIADLSDGTVPILTREGEEIWKISDKSLKRLVMEGTGRLSDGRVVNVDKVVGGSWRYKVMGSNSPHGIGIRGKALVPWGSVAHQLKQLLSHDLFNREVIIPSMRGYSLPDGTEHSGRFRVHDTGGGLRECPYDKGIWRTGESKSKYGQFDLFIGGPETLYNSMLGTWNSYRDVFVMPRDTKSSKGIQETLNLLMDAGLHVDGIVGNKTKASIGEFQKIVGLECSETWDENTKLVAEKSLENWDESI